MKFREKKRMMALQGLTEWNTGRAAKLRRESLTSGAAEPKSGPFLMPGLVVLVLALLLGGTGCETAQLDRRDTDSSWRESKTQILTEGGTLRISFPGNPSLCTTQQLGGDGRITLPLKNEMRVIGMTPAQVERKILNLYSGHLEARVELSSQNSGSSSSLIMREGDVLKVSFPGVPNMDTSQAIRRDGAITLPLIGEVKAVGLAPSALEKELITLYATKLVSKQVVVTLEASSFSVFVTGAVLHPGKIVSAGSLTALEAIMEAGGFDYTKANQRAVRIIRREDQQMQNYTLDIKANLEGKQDQTFYLKPSDIVYVPERFTWF